MEFLRIHPKEEYAKFSKEELVDYTEFMHKTSWNLQGNWM
jgi:hypothetical protein